MPNSIENITSSEDSISDSLLDKFSILLSETVGGGGGGGGGGTDREVGRGGVGRAIRNGAGIFILFIKCKTYNMPQYGYKKMLDRQVDNTDE